MFPMLTPITKTATDQIPPDSTIFSGENQRISDIILDLRSAFRSSDFNRAEEELVAREEALRREISRLKEENQSKLKVREVEWMEKLELQNELAATEERLAKAIEHISAEEKEKDKLSAEVSKLRRKLEESSKRFGSLENDVRVLGLRNSGVKSSPVEPILILDSDDDSPMEAKSLQKESLWCSKVPKREQYCLLPKENPGDRTVPNGDMNQEHKVSPTIKHESLFTGHYPRR